MPKSKDHKPYRYFKKTGRKPIDYLVKKYDDWVVIEKCGKLDKSNHPYWTLENKKTLINNLAFVLDTPSNLDITCYQIGTEYCMFKSNLNYYNIPVTIYTKSRIIDTNDDN